MDKKQFVDQVLGGDTVQRPPVSMWYHFGTQYGDGAPFARTSLAYFRHYDFDFLKVMNDYFYPPPRGLDAVRTAEDLARLERFDVETSSWREQFRALEIIGRELDREAYFVDTVFDAWQSIHRNLAAENMAALMENTPEALIGALDRVTDNLIAYSRKSMRLGAAGIFLSIPAGEEILTREQFRVFVKPFARKLLEATADLGKFTILHVHGKRLFF